MLDKRIKAQTRLMDSIFQKKQKEGACATRKFSYPGSEGADTRGRTTSI